MGLTELPPFPRIVEWPQRTHGVPEAAVRQPCDILTPEDLLTATNNRDRNFSLLPESWTRIDVKIRSGDSRPLRHPQWFIGRMVKTTFALERGHGPPPAPYEWVLMEKRAPITDVNTFEVEARPPLTVIFLQQAYDMIFYEEEPEPKRTWEEQLNPPLPAVLGTGEGKGKGKGKDKGKVKGPLFRGGPAPQGYVDRWGRTRQYRYYKGGSKHCKEILQSPLPPQGLARPAGRPVISTCFLIGLCHLLCVGSREEVGSPDPTPTSVQTSPVRGRYVLRGGCPAAPPQDSRNRGSKETLPPMTCMMMRFVLTGTPGAGKPPSEQAMPLKHHGGRQWWKGVRIGEASHPGPPKARRTPHPNDPPWALQLVRATGAPTRISLTQVGGGAQWRWQLGSQPRLSSSDRPTPENALQSWLDRHLQALHVDSQQALQDLQGQWRTQGLPIPTRNKTHRKQCPNERGRGPGHPPKSHKRSGWIRWTVGRKSQERERAADNPPQPARPLVTWEELRLRAHACRMGADMSSSVLRRVLTLC